MIVGVMVLDLHAPGTHSLKEKRHIVSSVKEKIKNRFNVSLIESDEQDLWQKIQLAFAMVAQSRGIIEKTFVQIEDMIIDNYPVQMVTVSKDYI